MKNFETIIEWGDNSLPSDERFKWVALAVANSDSGPFRTGHYILEYAGCYAVTDEYAEYIKNADIEDYWKHDFSDFTGNVFPDEE